MTKSQSLDKRLDIILKSNAAVQVYFDKDSEADFENLVPAIKQAFKDEGWQPNIPMLHMDKTGAITNVMTGPECLARFEKAWLSRPFIINIPPQSPEELATMIDSKVLEAARRAAGADDE